MRLEYNNLNTSRDIGFKKTITTASWLTSLMLLFALIGQSSFAQVANYTFGNATGTYTPIAGTVYQSGAAVSTNGISAQIPLGFTFRYNNKDYTSVAISNNGFIVLGTMLPAVGVITPISQTSDSSTATNKMDGTISGFGCDLVASTGTPSIQYGPSGADFVIQYTDMARTGQTADRINYQIRLTQTTNVITFIYGTCSATTGTGAQPQVGLRGSGHTDFRNLTSAATTAWTAPTNQATVGTTTGNNSTLRFSSTAPAAAPDSGRTFTFTPAAALGAPTYAAIPATENFDGAWINGNATADLPSASWRSWPSYGDRSWRRNDVTYATAGWTGTALNGAITVAAPAAGTVARWHTYSNTALSTGYMDYHVDFSTTGEKLLQFSSINTSGNATPDNLKIYLSTDGGATFGAALATYAVVAAWTNQSLVLGSSASATTVIRFEATGDWGTTDIGIDNVTVTLNVSPPNCASGFVPADLAVNIQRNATVSWTAATGNPSSYDVYFGTSPTPPLVGNQAGLSYTPPVLAASTLYYWKIVPKNANGDAVGCSTQSFTTGTNIVYCTATYSNGCGSLGADAVTNVTLGTLSNTSGCAASPYYTFYNAVTVPNVQQGSTVNVVVSMSTDSTQAAGAWIDFNQNGTFEPSEGQVSALLGASGIATLVFNVPVGASLGNTRMRVRGGDDVVMTTAQACGASGSTWGETEDYIVNIIVMPTDTPDYYNLQYPDNATILAGGSATVYGQVYEGGLTDVEPGLSGQATGIEAWVGVSPIGSNTNPNTWTSWTVATHNAGHVSNNDEYQANIGSTLVAGTYYYATRYRLNGGPFVYGGYPNGAWNGSTQNSGVLTVNANPTQCASTPVPANGATNITIGAQTLTWTAPGSGPAATSYDVYSGTVSESLVFLANVLTPSINVNVPAYSTTYYWRVVPKSTAGGDATGCAEWSFTTQADPFAPYCSAVAYTSGIEPITSVNFAGINNQSPTTVGPQTAQPPIQNFISIQGNVTTENTYVMTLKGNTDGNFVNNFRVFIDWNQDGDLSDLGEIFNAGTITNSTGLDAVQATSNIAVPSGALAGPTRMRVKKLYQTTNIDNPCVGGGFGQTEDYTINVTLCTQVNWYVDADGDTKGDVTTLVSACNSPGANYVNDGTDCNDGDANVWQDDQLYTDADGDGYDGGDLGVVCYGATLPVGTSLTTLGADCNDNIAAINPGATEINYDGVDNNCNNQLDEGFQIKTKLLPSICDTTLASMGSLIGITTVSSAITGYRIRATNGAQVQVIERNVPHFTLPNLPSYEYATTYTIEIMLQRNGVWLGYYGDPCTISSPAVLAEGGATQVNPSQCGITLPKINTLIATTSLAGATGYRFKVTNVSPGASGPNVIQTIDRTQHWFSLPMLAQYNYNSTYTIEVAVKTTGTYSGYGAPCSVTSPGTSLINCGDGESNEVVIATANSLVAATSLQGATQYRFQVVRVSDNATTSIDRNVNYFTFNLVPAYSPGVDYSVRVAVMTVGTWSPFGDACIITSPGTAARFTPETVSTTSETFKANVYPNPFATTFAVDVTTSSADNMQINVYDMTGRLIESRDVKSTEINALQVGDRLPSGVYNVIVTQGANVETLRVIKR